MVDGAESGSCAGDEDRQTRQLSVETDWRRRLTETEMR